MSATLDLTDTGHALAKLARLSTSSGQGQAACVRAVEVFGRPPTGISVPLNRKTTQQAILTLTLEGLEPRQELVPVHGLESYIVKPRRDPPDVARVQMRDGRERLLIQEGHTRLGAAVLRGDTQMPVRVWEFVQTDTGGFAPVVRGRQAIYERIRDRKATGQYRNRMRTLAVSFGIDLVGNEHSGNYGHEGRPGHIGGSGPGKGDEHAETGEIHREKFDPEMAKRLPEGPDRYFIRDERTVMLPLDQLDPIRAREKGIANASGFMEQAARGEKSKRGPISVSKLPNGRYRINDGNSTFAIASRAGWKEIPVHVDDAPTELSAEWLWPYSLYGTDKSGNYGHAGRPGQVGGSAPEGVGGGWGGSGVTGGHETTKEHTSKNVTSEVIHHAIEHAKLARLKEEWGDLNRELFKHMGNPDSPEYIAIMEKQQANVKERCKLNLDNGHITEGIKMPGGPRDVVVIGAGPGGLNAAINGGTEGLDTLLIDANLHVGGQIAATSRIENFGGHPAGVSGKKLGSDMLNQAKRVGAELMLGVKVTDITHDSKTGMKTVHLSNGEKIEARTVILGTGMSAIRPTLPGSDAANVVVQDNVALESHMAEGGHAIVVGGANSSAQAAMGALAAGAEKVTILARSGTNNISETVMDTIKSYVRAGQIEIRHDEIAEIHKDAEGRATGVTLKSGEALPTKGIGFFIGGKPATGFLKDTGVKLTDKGLIRTNRNLETTMPGVFAVGDSRAGSEDMDTTGRAGAAHGQGQEAIRNVFKYIDRVGKERVKSAVKAERRKAKAEARQAETRRPGPQSKRRAVIAKLVEGR